MKKKENILEFKFIKIIDCCSQVAFWNYWDHEHLEVVHSGYDNFKIIYEQNDTLFSVRDVKLPLIRLRITTPMFMKQINKNELVAYATQLGVLSETKVNIQDISKDQSKISVTYKFYLSGWKKIFKYILKYMVPIWHEKVWIEDLPLKLRRQKVLRYNFKDFIGLPKKIKDRVNEENLNFNIPLPRPNNSLPPSIKNKK